MNFPIHFILQDEFKKLMENVMKKLCMDFKDILHWKKLVF